MTAPAPAAGPVIVGTSLGPGHDGRAELVVELAYANGGHTRLSVTQEALVRALDAAGVTSVDELHGRSWSVLMGGASSGDRRDAPTTDEPHGTGSKIRDPET